MKSKSRTKRRPNAPVRAQTKLELESEPSFRRDPEVVEWGGELYWAVDCTSGGAPIGLRLTELREMEARSSNQGWARAKRVLDCVFNEFGEVDIGRVVKVGQGFSYEVFAATVELQNDPDGCSGNYAVLLPIGTEARMQEARLVLRERVLRERAICRHVAAQTTSIRVPDFRAIIPMSEGNAIVRPFLRGIPLDLRAGRHHSVRPWEIVAQAAATIHAIDVASIGEIRGFATRRAHALSELEQLEGLPEFFDAYNWAIDHLPPDEPSVLIHGDLLGQNILLDPDDVPAVIDWEHAMLGDPAYDLAIVTRGVKKPFAIDRGLERLLDAYANIRQRRIAAHEVHFYELCLIARRFRDALDGNDSGESVESRWAS
jgi:aminoglycoside phosphotransferase